MIVLKYIRHKFKKNLLSYTQNKNLFFNKEYYKIVSKKYLTINKSNFCFNLIFLVEVLSLLGFRIYFE